MKQLQFENLDYTQVVVCFVIFILVASIVEKIVFAKYRNTIEKYVNPHLKNNRYKKENFSKALYYSYKQLDDEEFKLSKMLVNSQDTEPSFYLQVVDFLNKLVLTVLFAMVTATIATSNSLIGLFKDNPETTNTLVELLGIYPMMGETLFRVALFGIVILKLISSNLSYTQSKRKLLKVHKTIIDEIVEEKKEEKKSTA